MNKLQDAYEAYTKVVSANAPSMKTLRLLKRLCLPNTRVLDLGSGFSSYYLRYFEIDEMWTVISVDDSPQWLQKTKQYCKLQGVKDTGFFLWPLAFPMVFDVVFVDIGITKARPQYIGPILENYCGPKTMILFDDMHKPIIRRAIEKELSHYTYLEVGVKDQTIDEYGRYCKLIFRLQRKEHING